MLDALGKARMINRLHEAPVVAAWDVEQLDAVWMDVFMGMAYELPAKRKRIETEQERFRKFEQAHPTYGPTLRN